MQHHIFSKNFTDIKFSFFYKTVPTLRLVLWVRVEPMTLRVETSSNTTMPVEKMAQF